MLVFNANTQEEEEATWSADANGELVCTFPDDHFLKFPAGTTKEEVMSLLEQHKLENEGNEVITPEMEAAKAAEMKAVSDLASELNGNTIPEGSQTNAPAQETQPAQAPPAL